MPNNELSITQQAQVVKYYKPSELLGMFTSYLSQQDVNRQVIYLQGIYLKNPSMIQGGHPDMTFSVTKTPKQR